MFRAIRRDARTIIIAVVAASLTAGAPAIAHGVHAAFAHNADKVDGKHAVGSGATTKKRKGKLVATSGKTGRLPNNIIAKAADANKLDGIDSSNVLPGGSLPRGATIRGIYTQVAGPGEFFHAPITFGYTLPGDVASSNVHFIPAPPAANPAPVSCPGTADDPQAAAGHLCVYEKIRFNAGSSSICRPDICGLGVRAWGGFLQASLTDGNSLGRITGAWAVTAGGATSVTSASVDGGSVVRGPRGSTPTRRD